MQTSEVIILLIILFLAIPFGYFLHKAIGDKAYDKLLESLEQLKLINSQQYTLITQLKEDLATKADEIDNLKTEFFQLTLTSKTLEEKQHQLQQSLLEKQYEIPPDYDHLKESNALLQEQIQKSRAKISKWKKKDFLKENKILLKKVKKQKSKLIALKEQNEKLAHSHKVLNQIKKLTSDGIKAKEVLPQITKEKNTEKPIEKNIFKHQPEIKKRQIFNELLNKPKTVIEEPVIDLDNAEKTLADLVGMDDHSVKILKSKGVHTFDEMIQLKIKELAKIFADQKNKYPYETWPIQARLALRGEWELIEEYKNKD